MHRLNLIRTCTLLFLLFPQFLAISAGAQSLEQAEDLLRQRSEKTMREGAQMCADLNSPEAVELLMKILRESEGRTGGLSIAHYRDIVWEGLLEITDAYARRVVEAELKSNKKSAEVRQWCCELLGLWNEFDLAPTVARALSDKELVVKRAAARALGEMKYEKAAGPLKKAAKHKDPYLRANAIEALVRLEPDEHLKAFEKGLQDKDGGVRCALLACVGDVYPETAEVFSALALADEDWRPRLQAVDNLGQIRTKGSIDSLIDAIDDARPVVGIRALETLQELTAMKFTKLEQWTDWWTQNRETFAFPEGRAQKVGAGDRSKASYNGIPIVSDHVAFLIDKSERMSGGLEAEDMKPKDEAARNELERVLTRLEGDLTFNVYTYNAEIEGWRKFPAELTKKTKKEALAFVEKQPTVGHKDIWGVLETVVQDPTLDTIYLLSSGEPDIGQYVHWNRLTEHLADLNRFHKVVVHSVAYSDNQWYRDQLEKIAEVTGGKFHWLE